MSFALAFDAGFFAGGSSLAEVPDKFDIALDGHGFMLYTYPDTAYERKPTIQRTPIPFLAPQQDNSGAFGERSLSNEELVRRSQDSWDHGAGQTFLDRADSDNRRFRSSKGIDVWTQWQMSLLPDTTQKLASGSSNLQLAVVGTRLYVTDGTALQYTTDLTGTATWTAVTGLPSAATSLATDGFNVWTAHASGVYGTTRTTGASALVNSLTATVIGYVKGRLMAANLNSIYNITNYGVTTPPATSMFTHPNTDWRWVGFAEGQTGIYAGGFSGDQSDVYRVTIKADGSSLDFPTHAFSLPDGELLTGIGAYVNGIIVLGTSKGVRFGIENGDGTLNVGAYIPTPNPVLCFEGQDDFVWYGLSNYDSLSTGLGRLHPTTIPDATKNPLVPAYASDLMVTGQGAVLSIATFQNRRVMAVSSLGVYREATNKVTVGTLDTGLLTYGLPDPKVGMFVDVKVQAPVDTNRAYVSADSGPFRLVGARSTILEDPFQVGQVVAETFEVRHELLNADTDPTAGPVITRWTFRAYPNPHQGEYIEFTLDLGEAIIDNLDTDLTRDPQHEYELIRQLQQTRQLFQLQFGQETITAQIDTHQYQMTTKTADRQGWNGLCSVRCKSTAI